MISPRLQWGSGRNLKKLLKVLCPVFMGGTLVLLVGFWAMPEASAVPSAAPLLAPGNPDIHPGSNSHTASVNTTVSITYDEAIDAATVSTRTFAVHAMQTGLLTETYGVNGGTISLTPARPFKPGELVQVSATTRTLSLSSGEGPFSPTVWQFWTAVVNGSGVFSDSGQSLGISNTYGVALGDLDGDGDIDAFVGNRDQANQVWLNYEGTFTDSGQRLGISNTYGVALGDVDGDGDLDAFVANGNQANQVWKNNGTGWFENHQSLGSSDSRAVVLGDLNGDGYLDAFVANDGANQVWLNDRNGGFVNSESLGNSTSQGAALGDVDGDGDLDVLVANDEDNKIWFNDGNGSFVNSDQSLGVSADSRAVALVDVDNDGDLDAFVANGGANKIWLNDGSGQFDDSDQSLGSLDSRAVAPGDVDGDGDLDVLVGNGAEEQANKVWLNEDAILDISLHKTVGTGTGCATTDVISVSAGTQVTYCYQVTNNSNVRYDTHDLVDSVLGSILSGYTETLKPGDAFWVSRTATITQTTINTATWTAAGPYTFAAMDVATVMVPAISLNKTVGTGPGCASTDPIGVITDTQVTYCYRVTNIGDITLTTHTLYDSKLGEISFESPSLGPQDTWFVTQTAIITETTVNSAVWTASAGDCTAVAMDTARVAAITPVVHIDQIMPNPSYFPNNSVRFYGSGVPTTITAFLEYEWTRIPVSEACESYLTPILLGTEARITVDAIPPGEYKVCLRGWVNDPELDDYDEMMMTVRSDPSAYSDIAVGPRSISFWADPSAKDNPIINPDPGDTVYVKVEVHNISVSDTPDDDKVVVRLFDGPITTIGHAITGTLIDKGSIDSIAAQTFEFITISWTIGGNEGYRAFTVDAGYAQNISYFADNPLPPYEEPHYESDYQNNRVTIGVPIGRITGTYDISVTADVTPIPSWSELYAGYPARISGSANYAWDVLMPTMGATTTIWIRDLLRCGTTYGPYKTWTKSPLGDYGFRVQLPSKPGIYTAKVRIDDGNLTGLQSVVFTVLDPPPPLPDLYVKRFSVLLSGPNTYVNRWQEYTPGHVYNRSMLFGVQNEPITITARVRNGGNKAATAPFAVSFYDGPPGGGTLIGTETITSLAPGDSLQVTHIWTPTQTGIHAIQVWVDKDNLITERSDDNNYDNYYYQHQLCYNCMTDKLCDDCDHRDVIDVRSPGPDLRAEWIKPGDPYFGPDLGTAVTLRGSVGNIGHAAIITRGGVFTLTVYDGYPNIGAVSTITLTAFRVTGPLTPGYPLQTFDVVWDTNSPGTVAGWHPICAEVDTGEEIDEELEENNITCWDLYVFPLEDDLYPYKLTYSNNDPLPNEEIDIWAWFENWGAEPFTRTNEVITFYHKSPIPGNMITTTLPLTLPQPIAGRRGTSVTNSITWTTYDSHGTAYIYVEYIKKHGDYNLGARRRHAQRLNIRKNPPPDLRVLSKDIHVIPKSPIPYNNPVTVTVDIANVSHSPIATATDFIVGFHISGPTSGYQELGELQTIASLGPRGMITTVQASGFTMDDKFYAIQVSVWPRIEQGDKNYGDNEATTSIIRKGIITLNLIRTVGTEAGICASTDAITVTADTPVFYCYQMTNRSDVFLGTHDLLDDKLGNVLSGYAYDLSPGETFQWIESATLTETTVNTAAWTASTSPYAFTVTDTATVNVVSPSISLRKTVGTDVDLCAPTSAISVPAGTQVTYCYQVTNTGDITLTTHILTDNSQLGSNRFDYLHSLSPDVTWFVTRPVTITETTINTATWTAWANGFIAVATDIATVNVVTPLISLNKTVGTEAGLCAITDVINVLPGTQVTYCYQVTNNGNVTLTNHVLVDSELGSIAPLTDTLGPGETFSVITGPVTITKITTNTATWRASANGHDVEATDTARVNAFRVYLPLVLGNYYLPDPTAIGPFAHLTGRRYR